MKVKNGPDVPDRTGKLVLLISGAATGKTTATRKWVAESPEARKATDHAPDAREWLKRGYDVALEVLVSSMIPDDLYQLADQVITDPINQQIEF
jgi:hypothetical protein